MNQTGSPVLSIVVIAFSGPALLERCLESLEGQEVASGVEIVVVGHMTGWGADVERLKQRFGQVLWVVPHPGANVPQMRCLGTAHSRGAVVALLEDDCVAERTWSAAVLRAHEGRAAAVGGAVEPGEFATALDWAAYFSEYSRFMLPLQHGPARTLPGTNVSYKRSLLEDWGRTPGGQGHFGAEGLYEAFFHDTLRRAGEVLIADPSLVVRNSNTWRPQRAISSRFHHARGFAGMRVARQYLLRRWLFLSVAVLLPLVQTARITREVAMRRRHVGRFLRALPWVMVLAVAWSTGEFVGYLLGPGASLRQWR